MARKVNTKFLVILTLAVGGSVVGAFAVAAYFDLGKGNPEEHLVAARKLTAEGKYDDAVEHYKSAISLRPDDPAIFVEFGDYLYENAWVDREYIPSAPAAWKRALEIDPGHLPALRKLLTFYEEAAKLLAQPESFQEIRSASEKIIRLDPDDARAAAAFHTATLRGWLSGLATDERKVDQSTEALAALMEKDPGNPDLPSYVARAKIKRALEYHSQGQARQASETLASAVETVEKSLEARPDDPVMRFRAGQVFMILSEQHPDPEQRARFAQRYGPEIEKAAAGVTPEHENFFEVNDTAARLAVRNQDLPQAERIYRHMLEKKPEDLVVRLAVGKFLGDAHRLDEAVALLSKPFGGGKGLKGPAALMTREIEVQIRVELGNLLLSSVASAESSDERERLLKQVKQIYDETSKYGGNSPQLLRFRGRAELADGRKVEGVQSLAKAKSLLDQRRQRDEELNYLLARAYALTNQTGEAKALFSQILERHPGFFEARLRLAELLVRENAVEAAKQHLDVLEKEKPDDPGVIRLRLVTTDSKRTDDLQKYFDELPEGSRLETFTKIQIGLALGFEQEGLRMLEELRAANAGDPEAALLLSQMHLAKERKDQALAVVQDALAHNPEHSGLKLLAKQISGEATAEELAEMRRSFVMKVEDPFQREMQLADLARVSQDLKGYEQHLKNAEKIRPGDGKLADALFHLHLSQNKLTEAEKYLDRLKQANQDDAGGLLYRFKMAAARSDEAEAMGIAQEVVKLYPEFSRSWLTLGQAQQANGRFQEAIQSYSRALEKQSDNVSAIRGLAQSHYSLNQPEQAKRFITRGREAVPGDVGFREMEINHELTHGQPEKAVGPLEELIEHDPRRGDLAALLGAAYLRMAQQKEQTAKGAGEAMLTKARATLQDALQKWPDEQAAYVHMAELLTYQRDYVGVEKLLKEFAGRPAWNQRPEPYLMLADFYASAGNLLAAEEAARSAMANSGGTTEVRRQLADVLARQAKLDEALEMLEPLKGQAQADRQRAQLLLGSGRPKDAESELKQSLEKNPDDLSLLHALALMYFEQRRYEEALTPLNRIVERDPRNATARYYRGLVRLRGGNPEPELAITDLAAARDVNPEDVKVRTALVEAYRRHNQPERAIKELEAVLKQNPASREVRLALIDSYTALIPPDWKQVERLVYEAQANMQMSQDPVWYERGAQMWAAREDGARALDQVRKAMQLAPGERTTRVYLDVLLQNNAYQALLDETASASAEGQAPWWMSNARAVARRRLNDRDGAMVEFEAALSAARTAGDDVGSETVIRSLAREIGAAEAVARVEQKAKEDPRWRLIAALLYQNNRDYDNAMRMCDLILEHADELEPRQRLMALRFAGTIYQSAQPEPALDKAEQAYRRALEVDRDDLASLNNLASLLADRGSDESVQQALVYSEQAYTIMKKAGMLYPFVLDTHGWALTAAGNVDEGMDLLQQAVEKQPSADSHYHLAEAYLRKSFPEEARAHLQQADLLLREAERGDSPFDASLRRKIDNATARADGMIRAKSRALAQ